MTITSVINSINPAENRFHVCPIALMAQECPPFKKSSQRGMGRTTTMRNILKKFDHQGTGYSKRSKSE